MKIQTTSFRANPVEKKPIDGVKKLSEKINKVWEAISPSEQEEIIDALQDTVDTLRFQHVFPIVRDLKSFTNKIHKLANTVLKTNSLASLNKLSPEQQKEILGGSK